MKKILGTMVLCVSVSFIVNAQMDSKKITQEKNTDNSVLLYGIRIKPVQNILQYNIKLELDKSEDLKKGPVNVKIEVYANSKYPTHQWYIEYEKNKGKGALDLSLSPGDKKYYYIRVWTDVADCKELAKDGPVNFSINAKQNDKNVRFTSTIHYESSDCGVLYANNNKYLLESDTLFDVRIKQEPIYDIEICRSKLASS